MKAKDVKVGQFYNHTFTGGTIASKVLVKSRTVDSKSGIMKFEAWEENGQEPNMVPARELSPIS